MIFLCFSVKDRMLINDFYHFLSNFGLDVWYDRRNIFLGDDRRYTNIEKGVENSNVKYAIVFYSENFRNGNICLEEFEILLRRYEKKEIFIFPVFISDVPDEIDEKFKLCKTLVFKLIHNQSDFSSLALHIIAKITSDEIGNSKYKSIKDIEQVFDDKESILYQMITEYQNIRKTNYNMRIAFLFALHMIISCQKSTSYFHNKTMNFIYHQNCLNVLIDEKRELQIMENVIVYEMESISSIV